MERKIRSWWLLVSIPCVFVLGSVDMRKALPRDVEKKSMVRLEHPVLPEDVD